MPNQYTKTKTVPVADANLAHVLAGPSNEELTAKHEAAEAARKASGFPKVEVLRDTTARAPESSDEKAMEAWGDPDYDPLGMADPMQNLKRTYGKEGFALKLLSENVCSHLGRRDYRIVKDANGDPVRMGKLVLGEIPERIAAARRQRPIRDSAEALGQIEDSQKEAIAKLKQDAGEMGLELVKSGDTVDNSGHSRGDGKVYDMGIMVDRDLAPAA